MEFSIRREELEEGVGEWVKLFLAEKSLAQIESDRYP